MAEVILEKCAFPPWIRKDLITSENIITVKRVLAHNKAGTVCESGLCPNLNECFSMRRMTFLILGKSCTRSCGFCSVDKSAAESPDPGESGRILEVVKKLELEYVVITSVTRDDLEDGGAGQFADAVSAIKGFSKGIKVEILVPDFNGNAAAVEKALNARPDIFGHNIETIKRLYPYARPGSDYERSLGVLRLAKDKDPYCITKSGLMLGLGEEGPEVIGALEDIRAVGCDMLTIGQYLRPRPGNLPVARFIEPGEFVRYKEEAEDLGFKHVEAGPFVRSSYFAEEGYRKIRPRGTSNNII